MLAVDQFWKKSNGIQNIIYLKVLLCFFYIKVRSNHDIFISEACIYSYFYHIYLLKIKKFIISREYTFKDNNSDVVTILPYKITSLPQHLSAYFAKTFAFLNKYDNS